MSKSAIRAGALALALVAGGCGADVSDSVQAPEMPRFADPALVEGRGIWMGTCRPCHLLGVAGAPAVTDYGNWEARIAKGMPALYIGPINGIKHPNGRYKMPPRAGNNRLADSQIKRAVDYMVAAARILHQQSLD